LKSCPFKQLSYQLVCSKNSADRDLKFYLHRPSLRTAYRPNGRLDSSTQTPRRTSPSRLLKRGYHTINTCQPQARNRLGSACSSTTSRGTNVVAVAACQKASPLTKNDSATSGAVEISGPVSIGRNQLSPVRSRMEETFRDDKARPTESVGSIFQGEGKRLLLA
jgi:hypothetical protein